MSTWSEKVTRQHFLELARAQGFEKPLLDIFHKVDEALKNAKTKEERDIIALQGMAEIDSYFIGGCSNLTGVHLPGFSQAAVDKFNKR